MNIKSTCVESGVTSDLSGLYPDFKRIFAKTDLDDLVRVQRGQADFARGCRLKKGKKKTLARRQGGIARDAQPPFVQQSSAVSAKKEAERSTKPAPHLLDTPAEESRRQVVGTSCSNLSPSQMEEKLIEMVRDESGRKRKAWPVTAFSRFTAYLSSFSSRFFGSNHPHVESEQGRREEVVASNSKVEEGRDGSEGEGEVTSRAAKRRRVDLPAMSATAGKQSGSTNAEQKVHPNLCLAVSASPPPLQIEIEASVVTPSQSPESQAVASAELNTPAPVLAPPSPRACTPPLHEGAAQLAAVGVARQVAADESDDAESDQDISRSMQPTSSVPAYNGVKAGLGRASAGEEPLSAVISFSASCSVDHSEEENGRGEVTPKSGEIEKVEAALQQGDGEGVSTKQRKETTVESEKGEQTSGDSEVHAGETSHQKEKMDTINSSSSSASSTIARSPRILQSSDEKKKWHSPSKLSQQDAAADASATSTPSSPIHKLLGGKGASSPQAYDFRRRNQGGVSYGGAMQQRHRSPSTRGRLLVQYLDKQNEEKEIAPPLPAVDPLQQLEMSAYSDSQRRRRPVRRSLFHDLSSKEEKLRQKKTGRNDSLMALLPDFAAMQEKRKEAVAEANRKAEQADKEYELARASMPASNTSEKEGAKAVRFADSEGHAIAVTVE
uniref:Uncharacterized protein n=1 Tax=Palpitomonas bilix TaxID=652834 RepID=A0A7S3CUS3_9EUKA|mmetsp:Transcript_1025/g.2124  ORF Transcript_1025/g.2124 Transcript_1025/m.2124 type:complete len:667 (+) Transcript_1025:69-2069(+)